MRASRYANSCSAIRPRLAGPLNAALELASKDRDAETGTALALAFLEDPRAETLVNDLDRRFPESTLVQFGHLPFVRAQLALNRRDPARAIEILQPAASYELGWQCPSTGGFCGSLYVIYMRGQAYMAAHRGAEAAAEFQKIIDHIGVVSNDPTIVVAARLQLARALALSGDRAKAKTAYEDFLKYVERCRSRYPDSPTSEGGILKITITAERCGARGDGLSTCRRHTCRSASFRKGVNLAPKRSAHRISATENTLGLCLACFRLALKTGNTEPTSYGPDRSALTAMCLPDRFRVRESRLCTQSPGR